MLGNRHARFYRPAEGAIPSLSLTGTAARCPLAQEQLRDAESPRQLFVAAILTVVSSCQQQGRNVLAYLTACCRAFYRGRVGPSLLPCTSSHPLFCYQSAL